jgi:hypothetical protein
MMINEQTEYHIVQEEVHIKGKNLHGACPT